MFGLRTPGRKAAREEGEKPFWISYSDMMTALMVLFLVVMTVALLAVTNEASETDKQKTQRENEIAKLLAEVKSSSKEFPGIIVHGSTIDFGDQARFETDSNRLTKEQEVMLRQYIPKVLNIARSPLGQKWVKRVVVEGFADRRGTYLHNLNLSLQRSQRVLCALLAPATPGETPLNAEDRLLIRNIFLVGGSSFNSLRDSLEESRRIEVKLEFLDLGEQKPTSPNHKMEEEQACPLDCQ